jgi:glycosyltransferase involved in cell wall biosynthesis
VLWLGQVNVRKGIHYLVEAARLLEREAVEFIVAGPIQIRREYMAGAPGNIKWLGPVPRNLATKLYAESDVFVLPTLSDGFALTQLEAIAHGLPVITTPNCGRVVEQGKTGYIVPARDGEALAHGIMRFVSNRGLAAEMRPTCLEAVKRYTLEEYGKRLTGIIEKRRAGPGRASTAKSSIG